MVPEPRHDKLRILIVDDHEVVRMGLKTLLESHKDLDVVGEAGEGSEAVIKALSTHPDVVLMDVRLPEREQRIIEACLEEQRGGGIRGFHHLRTRKAGRQRYVDVHLLVDPSETVAAAHDLCDRLEEAIRSRLPGSVVTIHLEPDDGRYRGPWHEEPVELGKD